MPIMIKKILSNLWFWVILSHLIIIAVWIYLIRLTN